MGPVVVFPHMARVKVCFKEPGSKKARRNLGPPEEVERQNFELVNR